MLKTRILTAAVLLLLLLLALFFLPMWGWAVMVIVMVMQGVTEWVRLAGFSARVAKIYWWLSLFIMSSLVWWEITYSSNQQGLHLFIYSLSVFFWLTIVPVWFKIGRQFRYPLLLGVVGWVVLIPTGLALMDLRAYSPWWLLGVMGLVWMADISAYFSGRKFGKHKLAPTISPGKTWEGVVGAILGVTVYVVSIAYFSSALATEELSGLAWPSWLLFSWFLVGLAVLGDLFESSIKRQSGVKDSGALLPGHGGLLDRVDALTSTLPMVAMVLLLQSMV